MDKHNFEAKVLRSGLSTESGFGVKLCIRYCTKANVLTVLFLPAKR